MFNQLYKAFLIAVISGSLTTLNVVAFAQDTTSSMVKSQASNITRDANGNLSKSSTLQLDDANGSDMLSSITMLAIGAIGARMAMNYRPITTDVMIAAAGAAAFIAGEVYSNFALKTKLDAMSEEITKKSNTVDNDAQIKRLEDLKKSYEEAKKTVGLKKMLQLGAAAAFAGAAAMATYYSFQEEHMDQMCAAAVASASTGLKSCAVAKKASGNAAAAAQNPPLAAMEYKESASCTACEAKVAAWLARYKTASITEKAPGSPSAAAAATVKPQQEMLKAENKVQCGETGGIAAKGIVSGVTAACEPALAFKDIIQTASPTGNKGVINHNKILNEILYGGNRSVASYEIRQSRPVNIFEQALGYFFPNAQAGWMPFMGLGAGIAASYFALDGSLGAAFDAQMFAPLRRATVFAVMAALAYLASNSSQNQIDQIQKNIDKIQAILDDLYALTKGVQGGKVNEQKLSDPQFKANQEESMAFNANPKLKTDCMLNAGSSNCTSMEEKMKSMPDFVNLPESFKTIASQSAQMADGLSGKNAVSASSLSAAGSLAGKQGAINKLLKATQKKLNDQLGKKKIDFAKEQNNLLKNLNANTAKILKQNGVSASGFLSNVGSSPIGGSSTVGTAELGKDAPGAASKAGGLETLGASAPGVATGKDKTLEFDFKDPAQQPTLAVGGEPVNDPNAKYDVGTNDINTNSNQSIFQMISDRYFKSGYPKLLDEIPMAPVNK